MPSTQLACPHCGSALNFGKEIPAGAAVECLICMRTFAANPVAAPAPQASVAAGPAPRPKVSSAGQSVPKGSTAQPPATAASPAGKPGRGADEGTPSGQGGMLAIALVLLLLVGGGIGVAVWKIFDSKKGGDSGDPANQVVVNPNKKDEPEKKPKDDTGGKKLDPEKKSAPPKKIDKKIDDDPDENLPAKKDKDEKKVLVRKDPPKAEDKEPETIPIVKVPPKNHPGLNQGKIDLAIDKGLTFLKTKQQPDGSWGYGGSYPVGCAALCALTLLECKVPAKDPAIQRAADYVRAKAGGVEKNYEATTSLLFLDRLGDPRDRPLIQTLALRLLAGQQADGGWSYACTSLSPQEAQQLLAFLQSHKKPNEQPGIRAETLSPALRALPVVYNQGKPKGKQALHKAVSDNSNTQFALLAMWAARRHDVPADQAILMAHDRFVATQNSDGGWAYLNGNSTNAMTCVGLIGLAMGHGISPDHAGAVPNDPTKTQMKPAMQDPRIKKGMEALSRHIGDLKSGKTADNSPLQSLYFMWSLERVGVLYDVNDIGGKDWYGWGADWLLTKQGGDGTFPTEYYLNQEPALNTCFALLFLNRSNLVQDLTVNLRLNSGIRDPEK